MKILKGTALAFVAILLILAGIVIIEYQHALVSWQAEVERLNGEIEQAQTLAESDYYRGVLSSCVGIGMQMGIPRELVTTTCTSYWHAAYENDWFNELKLDTWQWPPPEPSPSGITS